MPRILKLTRFGNPVLRTPTRKLSKAEIKSEQIQTLIADMRYTSNETKLGVAIAATQVGESIALSVISIQPTKNRPDLEGFESVIINPEIVQTYGKPKGMYEGCVSCGTADDILFGEALRYKKVKLKWTDENAIDHEEVLHGFVAHVAQHEVDHLNGILFVDKVTDPKTYMMADEYRKRIIGARNGKPQAE